MLAQPSRKEEAEASLLAVTDPRAVPTILRTFGTDKTSDQLKQVQLLSQVDAPSASRSLAALAVFARSPEVRRLAIETLKRRDVREFAGPIVALLRDSIKYEVRPVGGPGSPGALFIQGRKSDNLRRYSPPASPSIGLRVGDRIELGPGWPARGLPDGVGILREPGGSRAR